MEELSLHPPNTRRTRRSDLYAAILVPVFYFGAQLAAAPFYPGYSFAQDTASMLGTTSSRHPWIFNLGAILTGLAGLVGAFGLFRALRAVTWTTLAALVAFCVVVNGVLSLKAGLFPMPDPRHASWQFLMFPILIAPLLLLIALWSKGRVIRTYLLCNLFALLATLPFMFHRVAPVLAEGTMQRVFALVVFVPVGVAAYALAWPTTHSDSATLQ